MMLIWLGLAVLTPIVLLAVALVWTLKKRQTEGPHPSELSAATRSALRPVRQAADSLLELLKTDNDSARILGPDAKTSATEIVEKAARLGLVRDQMVEMAERLERQGLDATHPLGVIDRIDQQYSQATLALDQMSMRITQKSVPSSVPIPEDESLDALVSRLQNLGQSFDEAHDTLELKENE
ncbi:hypothetical protein QPK87_05840 [Kamptonema cortianum]|nr:hypothetical protein [Geitlerinema splendidum]MDK3156095.1 hypothetical protein [Kamptonema cortianum]